MTDLISRQAAIKAIEDLQDCYNGFSDTYDKACIIGVIEEVPPIEAIPVGWIEKQKAQCFPLSISWIALEGLLKTWEEERDEVGNDKENT